LRAPWGFIPGAKNGKFIIANCLNGIVALETIPKPSVQCPGRGARSHALPVGIPSERWPGATTKRKNLAGGPPPVSDGTAFIPASAPARSRRFDPRGCRIAEACGEFTEFGETGAAVFRDDPVEGGGKSRLLIPIGDSVFQGVHLMMEQGLSLLPVSSEEGTVLGVARMDDLFHEITNRVLKL